MPIEQLKIDDNKAENIRLEIEKIESLKNDVKIEAGKTAKSVIEWLTPAQLGTFIDSQFKKGEKYDEIAVMKDNNTYAFVVQAWLDAVSKDNRYENFLLGVDGKYGVDNNYGSRTRAAVRQFQTDAGFDEKEVDGIVWPKTMAKLVEALNAPDVTKVLDFKKPLVDGAEVYTEPLDIQNYSLSIFGEKKELQVNKVWRDKLDDIATKFGKDCDLSPIIYKVFDHFSVDDKWNLTWSPIIRSEFIKKYGLEQGKRLHEVDFAKLSEDPAVVPNGSIDAPVVTKTDTVPVNNKERINEDIYNITFAEVQSLFTGKSLAESNTKIANGNTEVSAFLKNNKLDFMNGENPNIKVKYWLKDGIYLYLSPINIHSILKNDVLDKDAIYSQLNKSIVDKIAKNKEAEKKAKILKNNKESVAKIKWMKWTLPELFPDKKDNVTYKGYFNTFDGAVKIDDDPSWTKLSNGKLLFDLDESGSRDEDYNRNKSIDMARITDADGKLDNAKFMVEIRKIVADAVESFKKDV
jgi:hypothetical protein